MKDDELINLDELDRELRLQTAQAIVNEQAEDRDLWFIIGVRERELKLQAELRRLHAAIEGQQYYIGEALDCNESDP